MIEITKTGFKTLDEDAFYTGKGITDDFDHTFEIEDQLTAERFFKEARGDK